MNLHEYQAKQIFKQYGLPVSQGIACKTAEEAVEAIKQLQGEQWAIKCQVHAGGRGKAGGVKLVRNEAEVREFADKWLGKRLVTFQTDANGQPVNTLYLEETCNIDRELYLGAVVDRSAQKVIFMASSAGGMNIEEVAEKTPELIHKAVIDPLTGGQGYQGRELAFKLGLKGDEVKQFADIFVKLANLFVEKDLALLEVNPLVITKEGQLLCLDAKMSIDSNALYRHPELKELQDPSQDDEREAEAEKWNLNYVALDGNIGCMVNGAGLAMGTMDIVKLYGGKPANFLDVGGGATKERVAAAFKLILSDPNVKAVLVNIFGGIVRCDLIADGVIAAVNEVGVNVPVIVRLEGTNAAQGREILANSGLSILAASSLKQAAELAVKSAN
ncbi:TPA: ADP-forming succinate--CoA ligase subunit beta [Mannheimia haemolytica]|uniref:Succinate--CoA ligase [ADP-forming] subunit beta n=1 Tax=Mannheimia haemolytica TaxID=75985 RepID=A0A547EPY7_MANHA|nr:ADP-forming succinate--CoA ligase subunit beta [Mannheimia haemolytica]AWW71437.1 ADP-forming succinate--CoA ligase subunit beta [Pasteurellaceae bacterium 12565]AGI32606.1 ADP-forming succinate--CoA ligase subunit beta [Mannheimia haemolytica USDA-ARS-USMARC-183]AGI35489.1 ADP-forming succinate--CoA ligase subunit beta [Mannheimia haemolytica USDA-ARS-USMARC-185]AGK02275.1 succinyl-CoA synthetase - subunit beta SucC [Mannheimia haemolytica M42548]AGQ24879.1 malate--CoA ligase subunit beta 